MIVANIGFLVVASVYFMVCIGFLFPITYWLKPRYSEFIQIIVSWFQIALVMIGYLIFLWICAVDMIRISLLVLLGGLAIFFIGVFTVLDALFVIKTGIIIPLKTFVSTGIYNFARHPIYAGISFILLGLAICFWSFFGTILALLIAALLAFLTHFEERELISRFDDSYLKYMAKTSKFNVFKGMFKQLKKKA